MRVRQLSYDGRTSITRAKAHYLVKVFKLRHGVDRLEPAFETVIKWMLSTGRYVLCHQYMSAHAEKTGPIRENAYDMLESDPRRAEAGNQMLVPIVLYGYEDGVKSLELLDQFFGGDVRRGLPSYQDIHGLTLAQAKHADTVGVMPNGTRIHLQERPHIGNAIVIDREMSRGRGNDAMRLLVSRRLRVRSFLDNQGLPNHDTFVSTLAAAMLAGKGVEFYTRTAQPDVDALHSQMMLRALGTALGVSLFIGAQAQPQPLTDMAMGDYFDGEDHPDHTGVPKAVVRFPAKFDGVLAYDAFEELLSSSVHDMTQPDQPTVHVGIVRSFADNDAGVHTFAVAWQCSSAHVQSLARDHATAEAAEVAAAAGAQQPAA
jgi:hypothetical protein